MLMEFTVGNYLSFREKKTLSLMALGISDYKETNTMSSGKSTLLKGALVYGANASGKSNLIRAMSTMKRIVVQSFGQSSTKPLGVAPFLLDTETEIGPSHFEILFRIEGIRYRYGFEVTDKEIVAEWLFESKKNTDKLLFIRQGDGIEVAAAFIEGSNLEEKTRSNALFLSVVDQFNGATAKRIMKWFDSFIVISGLTHENYEPITFKMLDIKETATSLQNFYNQLDLGFDDLSITKEKIDAQKLPDDLPEALVKLMVKDLEGAFSFNIKTFHRKFDSGNKSVGIAEFEMRNQESAGTNKLFNISGPIFDVLQKGGIMAIDELDASLHPLMTLAIVRLFNSTKDNPNNAQLIFTTHDTNLLSYGKYRRDQIYFVEKDSYGASDLYSLVEYREEDGGKIRKDRSFESDYIQGRYGAIPYIGDITKTVKEWREK